MKFFILLILTNMTSLSAHASQDILQKQFSQYQEAASLAFEAFKLQHGCHQTIGGNISPLTMDDVQATIKQATHGSVASAGEQPALTLYWGSSDSDSEMQSVEIDSGADYKTISDIKIYYQRLEDVNTGTLIEPTIVKQWIMVNSAECN